MFVSITFHPVRASNGAEPLWRSLFLTEDEASADAAHFLSLFPEVPGVTASVEPATVDDCAEYVERADESYAECRAEAGSGAMSLGFGVDGAYAAANAVSSPSERPLYNAARAFLAEHAPAPVAPLPAAPADDDIPF